MGEVRDVKSMLSKRSKQAENYCYEWAELPSIMSHPHREDESDISAGPHLVSHITAAAAPGSWHHKPE